MKFDNFYKLVCNEAISMPETDLDAVGQEITKPENMIDVPAMGEQKPTTPEEQENYVVQILKTGLDEAGKTANIEKLRLIARDLIDIGQFEKFYKSHEAEKVALEPLPKDLETDLPTSEDLPDVPALGEYEREREEEEREAEENPAALE